MFCKKGVVRNFAKSKGKHLCQRLFFNKVAVAFFTEVFDFFCSITQSDQVSLPDFVITFPSFTVKCVLCFMVEKLKFDYLKNEKNFRNEIKSSFPCFASALF